ncbi:MAG: DUF1573 domain-containing protein [Planctomycetaceae bacterium]
MARYASRMAGLVAAVPFLAAIVAHWAPTALTPIAAAPARPSLAFDQYLVDLREVSPRPVVPAHFNFTNTSGKPIQITKLVASCGCLNPQLYRKKDTYAPGERGRFYVTMRTANEEPGPHSYSVTVKYDDGQPHEETVQFRVVLPKLKVNVEPAEVYFYQLSGADDERTIYVSDRRGKNIEVQGAACTLEGVKVDVLPPETDTDGYARVPIKVSVPGTYAPGRHIGYITIATNDPEFDTLHAAILIEGAKVQQASAERPSP